MALSVGALTNYATVAARLGLQTTDARRPVIEALINEVSEELATLSNREFHRSTVASPTVELHEAAGTRDIWTRRTPIVSVTSVQELDPEGGAVSQTYSSGTYLIDTARGNIHRSSGWADHRYYTGVETLGAYTPFTLRVTYVGGWITPFQASADWAGGSLGTRDLPYDIEAAVIRAVVSASSRVGQDGSVSFGTNVNVSRTWSDTTHRELVAIAAKYNRGR